MKKERKKCPFTGSACSEEFCAIYCEEENSLLNGCSIKILSQVLAAIEVRMKRRGGLRNFWGIPGVYGIFWTSQDF